MNNDTRHNIALEDIAFSPLGDKEIEIINDEKNRHLFRSFTNRAIISVIAAAIIMISEYIGKFNTKNLQAVPGEFTFIIIALIIFNLLSYGAMILKQKMSLYGEHLSFVYGTVTEKYDNRTLSRQNKQKSKNYILFDTETAHCTTAVPVNNINDFNRLTIGESVLIVKSNQYGNEHFELYTILK